MRFKSEYIYHSKFKLCVILNENGRWFERERERGKRMDGNMKIVIGRFAREGAQPINTVVPLGYSSHTYNITHKPISQNLDICLASSSRRAETTFTLGDIHPEVADILYVSIFCT